MNTYVYQLGSFVRRSVYIALSWIDKIMNRKNQLVILCYHSISNDAWPYSVTPKNLKAQMRYMKQLYNPITMSDVCAYVEGKLELDRPSFVVTFDDGYENIYTTKSLFSKLNIQPTVFAISDRKYVNRKVLGTNLRLLSESQLRALKDSGWDIGSHSSRHEVLDSLPAKAMREQIIGSKKQLKKILNNPIHSFSYPKGRYSEKVIETVRHAGFTVGLSMDDGLITHESNRFTIPRIGVNNSHTTAEFATLGSPSVVAFRGLAKSFVRKLNI